MGIKALSKVQLGQETDKGTAVPADFIWRGPFAGMEDARTVVVVDEDIGIALPSSRSYTSQLLARLSQPSTELTPEQAVHILEAGIKKVNAGVADGSASSGFVYAYPFGKTAINDISTYTIETGDDSQAEALSYGFVTSFTISAVKGNALMIASEWAGRQAADATFTAAVLAPPVTHIQSANGLIYIDPVSGAFGGTLLDSGQVLEATLTVTTGWVPLFTIDSGVLYFVEHYFNKDAFSAKLALKYSYKGDVITERNNWRTDVPRLMRVDFLGNNYGTAGTGTAFGGRMGLRIDFPGVYESFSAVTHEDGLSVVSATLAGGYENDSEEGLALMIANELIAVP